MDVEEFRTFCLSLKGATEAFPFDESTLVFKVMGKMFALISLERIPHRANLKCDPERAITLREDYDGVITPGFHMNKTHWNTIRIAALSKGIIEDLVLHSYDLVVSKLSKTDKEKLTSIS